MPFSRVSSQPGVKPGSSASQANSLPSELPGSQKNKLTLLIEGSRDARD